MAQYGFRLHDYPSPIHVMNDSGTTALVDGDFVYFATNDDVLTTTFASNRAAIGADDILVSHVKWTTRTTAQYYPAGVMVGDCAADSYGMLARCGIFVHAVSANTEAGNRLQLTEQTTTKVSNILMPLAEPGTTAPQNAVIMNIGQALSGGATEGEYILWQLNLG